MSNSQDCTVPPAAQAALVRLCLRLLPLWEQHLVTARERSEAAVGDMLAAFSVISPLAQHAVGTDPAESATLHARIEQMYTGLQYQDRVSQMLVLLQGDLERLRHALQNPDSWERDLDADAWLARLESLYVMDDQRVVHGSGKPEAASGADEPTFF